MTGRPACLVYLFALTGTPPTEGAPAAVAGHDGGGPLRVVRAGDGLWLVVQDVPAAEFDEEALARRLNNPLELERCALAHHRGVAAAASRGPVVPLPMATLCLSDRSAVAAVAPRERVVRELLDRLTGRTEWAVKVHLAATGSAEAPVEDDVSNLSVSNLCRIPNSSVAGRSYLSRASARRRTERDRVEAARAAAPVVDRALREHAAAATRHRPQNERLTGRRAPQLLNAAYLVDDTRRDAFAATLARLRADPALRQVEITESGPWIPYSFAVLDEPLTSRGAGQGRRAYPAPEVPA